MGNDSIQGLVVNGLNECQARYARGCWGGTQ
jgi:hypothetical protein